MKSGYIDPASDTALRKQVLDTARAMSRSGLSPARSGNVSVRVGPAMLITPSGMSYEEIAPSDIDRVEYDGGVARGSRSSGWRGSRWVRLCSSRNGGFATSPRHAWARRS